MKNIVVNGFGRLNIPALLEKMELVIAQTTINAQYFKTPDPAIGEMQTAHDNLKAAAAESAGGDKFKKMVTVEKKVVAVDHMQKLGIYVNLMANGDRTIAGLSGFTLRELNKKRIIEPTKAPVLKLGTGRGELDAEIPYQPGMRSCTWWISADQAKPLDEWDIFDGENAKMTFSDLLAGTNYFIYVTMIGTNKQRINSPVAMMVA